jgi:hypothetical protein
VKRVTAQQIYDENGRHTSATSPISLSCEAFVLRKSFPTADPEALMNALAVCNNNIESAKAVRPAGAGAEGCGPFLPRAASLMRCCCIQKLPSHASHK